MSRVLVTGCTGFVGRFLCDELVRRGYLVRGAVRRAVNTVSLPEVVGVGDIGRETCWDAALEGVDVVIHLAARAHQLGPESGNAELYHGVNTLGTRSLVEAAGRYQVRRFIYLSTVKVNGEATGTRPFHAEDVPHPADVYGSSKWSGEKALWEIASCSLMEGVVVRPPLVYGPGVRANFLRLMRWVDQSVPLPLGAVRNTRSLVSVWNLAAFLAHVVEHDAAAGRAWMVSDTEDLSTPELVRRLGRAMNRTVTLLPVPVGILRVVGRVLGKGAEVTRLCGSLAVDVQPALSDLGWRPVLSVDEALARTASWYLMEKNNVAI